MSEDTGNRSLVPVPFPSPGPQMVPARSMDLAEDSSLYWTNLPVESPADKLALLNVLNGTAGKLRSAINTTLQVVGLCVTQRKWVNETTGEEVTGQPIVLVTQDGARYLVWGESARSCIGRILAIVGRGPWDPPLPLIIGTADTATGRMVYQITVDQSYLKVISQKKSK